VGLILAGNTASKFGSQIMNAEILDLRGRVVRSLTVSDGEETIWDGRDSEGHEVPVGLYLARIKNPGTGAGVQQPQVPAVKLMRLR